MPIAGLPDSPLPVESATEMGAPGKAVASTKGGVVSPRAGLASLVAVTVAVLAGATGATVGEA